jgi:hypothetical protein
MTSLWFEIREMFHDLLGSNESAAYHFRTLAMWGNKVAALGLYLLGKFSHRRLIVAHSPNTAMAASHCLFPGTISHMQSELTILPSHVMMPSVSVHLAINIVVVLILCEKLTAGDVEPLLTCAPLTATMFHCLLRDGIEHGCILLNA